MSIYRVYETLWEHTIWSDQWIESLMITYSCLGLWRDIIAKLLPLFLCLFRPKFWKLLVIWSFNEYLLNILGYLYLRRRHSCDFGTAWMRHLDVLSNWWNTEMGLTDERREIWSSYSFRSLDRISNLHLKRFLVTNCYFRILALIFTSESAIRLYI